MNIFYKNLKISKRIAEKLESKHKVTREEVLECFINREKGLLEDTRLNHLTHPPTLWFIAETDYGRLLRSFLLNMLMGLMKLKQLMSQMIVR